MNNISLIEKAEISNTFCLFPFTHIATKTDGSFKLCCRSLPVSNIQEESLLDFWNSTKMKEVRDDLLNNRRPEVCRGCWKHEDVGTRSMRQRSMRNENKTSRWNLYKDVLLNVDPDTMHIKSKPKSLEIKTSNICNLKCRMCHPVDSSSWAKDWKHIKHHQKNYNQWAWKTTEKLNIEKKPIVNIFDKKKWFQEINQIQNDIDVIEFAGGEPLLDPAHYSLLEQLKARSNEITLKYSTNLTSLKLGDKNIFDYWKNFKRIDIYVSFDGTANHLEYIRSNAKYSQIIENIRIVKENLSNLGELGLACTVQIYNISNIEEVVNFSILNEMHFHCHFLSNPKFLSLQLLPNECKIFYKNNTLKLLEKLKQEKPYGYQSKSRHLNDMLNYLNKDSNQNIMNVFIDYTNKLDQLRSTSFSDLLSEDDPLKKYFN